METTLHRQLKELYSPAVGQQEVAVNGYRIDAIDGDKLIEIQYGSLGAIREKIRDLLNDHDVHVVKPLAGRKYLVNRKRRGGRVHSSRYSPRRESFLDVFDDFVYFVNVFPHPRLTVELLLTEQEEHRVPGKRRRRWQKRFAVEDRILRCVNQRFVLSTRNDLLRLLGVDFTAPMTTADIAKQCDIPRWLAQKAAYCLRKTGTADVVGKRGNALLYQVPKKTRSRRVA